MVMVSTRLSWMILFCFRYSTAKVSTYHVYYLDLLSFVFKIIVYYLAQQITISHHLGEYLQLVIQAFWANPRLSWYHLPKFTPLNKQKLKCRSRCQYVSSDPMLARNHILGDTCIFERNRFSHELLLFSLVVPEHPGTSFLNHDMFLNKCIHFQ